MDNIIGYIYITVNEINNKVYVGKRQKSKFEKAYKGSGTHLKLAFKKYGKEKFHTYPLEWYKTEEDLCDAEIKWISYFKDAGFDMYNIAKGGKGGNMIDWSSLPETRRAEINMKNSESHKGKKNPFYGKRHSEQTKAIIKKKSNKRYPIELMKYKDMQRSKLPKIIQINKTTGEIVATWNNWCEASKKVSPNNRSGHVHISQCCRHERKSAYGFRWEFAEARWTI